MDVWSTAWTIRGIHPRHDSPRTQMHYIEALVRLSKYYNQSPADLSQDQIKDYLLYLINVKQVSRSTVY
jgi:hypothetical protein